LAFAMPFLTFLTILFIIAFWAIVTGVMQIVMAWRTREEIDNEIWLGLAGLMSIIFGVLVFLDPFAGSLATIWVIGVYSIIFGVMFIALAFRYRNAAPSNTVTQTTKRVTDNY
jgi:uncharacterized membrane protein HdeD (DUF308 family)